MLQAYRLFRRSRPLEKLGLKFELQLHVAHLPSPKNTPIRGSGSLYMLQRIDYFVGRRGETGIFGRIRTFVCTVAKWTGPWREGDLAAASRSIDLN